MRTNTIYPKMQKIAGDGHASWSQTRGLDCRSVHGFKPLEHAEAFRAWIAETYPELLPPEVPNRTSLASSQDAP